VIQHYWWRAVFIPLGVNTPQLAAVRAVVVEGCYD
jgi:hypothetical protein